MPGSDIECMLDPELGSLIVDQYVGDTDEHGCYSGYGEASFRRSGNTYAGEFRRGTMDGRGRYVWVSNGTIYEGDFSKNEIVGTGRYTWSNGSYYQGGVSNSLRNGEGIFTSADSTLIYEGFWKDGKRNGHGMQRYGVGTSCVSTYVGEWQENFRHGRGTMTYASGNTYEGDWVEDRKEGEGIMTWVHRRERYTGEWKADKQRGYGEHVWIEDRPNNSVAIDTQKQMCNVYKGQWLDGMRHDQGTFLYADGSRYVGYWLRNKKHGPAVFTSANGSTFEGRFEDDFMIDKMFQDHDHPELSSAIKLSITDIIPCGHDTDTTSATVREVERSAFQINSDLRLAFKLYAKAGANAPRDSNMFTMSLQQFIAFAGDCRALAPCTQVTAGEVYRMFFRMGRQHAWELTSSLQRVLREASVDGGDISAACFGRQAGSSLAAWLPKRDAEDEIYDPRKAITFREFVEGVLRLATIIGDTSNGGGARLFPRANTELPTTPPSTAARTVGSRVTNAGSSASPRRPTPHRVDMAPVKGEGFTTGNPCAEACLIDNTNAPAEVSVNDHFKRFVDEHLRGLFSVFAESPGSCSGLVRGQGGDRVGSKEAVRFGSKARGQRWGDDVETEHMVSKAEELQGAEAQVKHLYTMYSGPLGNLMTLRGLLKIFRDADLRRRAGLTSAEIKEVFSQANASLKSHAGAESQGVPQSYSCIYEAPSEDKDVEASSETSDSTRLAEPGRSTTTTAPAVDLELLDQELMPDQFKIVVAELVKILRVKATTPAPLESSCDGPTAGSGAGRDGEGIAEGANVTENESEGGKDGSPGRAASGPEKGQEKYHQTGFTMEKRVLTGGTYQSQSIKGASPSQDLSPGYRDEPISCPPWLANPSVFISQVSAWAERGNIKRVRRVARWPTPNRNFAQHNTLERVFRQQSYG